MDNFERPSFGSPEPQPPQQPPQAQPAPAPTQSQPETQPQRSGDNTVFVGSKPVMNYVTSILMQFTNQNSGEVVVKARGKFISKAVDVVEVARKRFMEKQNINIGDIRIDTEGYEKEGKKINVSTIDIFLRR